MNQLVPYTPPQVTFRAADLRNIKALCQDATDDEFDRFIAMCRARGLDPRLGHCHLFIFNQTKPTRSAVTVVSEAGYLAAADRCRDENGGLIYKPDDKPPRYTYDEGLKNEETNPLGIASATVSVFKYIQKEWHEIPAEVFWDERAPINESWEWSAEQGKRLPSGKFMLDPKKKGWRTQPRTMLAKCARVAAMRYAFPDQVGGLYAEEEKGAIERGKMLELTATELIQEQTKQEQMKALGADQAIMFDFRDGKGLVYIPLGMIHDRIEAHFLANPSPHDIADFCAQNRTGLREYHAHAPGEHVDLKQRYVDQAATAIKAEKAKAADDKEKAD